MGQECGRQPYRLEDDRFFGNSYFKGRNSDQGAQFTSHEFTSFCNSVGVIQSMSRAACPYDNSPMERFFNTLKTELIYLYNFHSKEQLYKAIDDFVYVFYNHVRPHSFNDNLTPFQKRSLQPFLLQFFLTNTDIYRNDAVYIDYYDKGIIFSQNISDGCHKALEWFKKAADLGDTEAMDDIACLYQDDVEYNYGVFTDAKPWNGIEN